MVSKKASGPTLKSIQANKGKFAENMALLATGKIKGTKSRLTVNDQLGEVKDQLLLCKKGITNKTISYAVIRQFLFDDLKLRVSEASLRKFCQTELGFPMKNIKRKTKEISEQAHIQEHGDNNSHHDQ